MEGVTISLLIMTLMSLVSCNTFLTTSTRPVNSVHMFEILVELSKNCLPRYQPTTIGIAYDKEMEDDLLKKLSKIACLTVIGYTENRDTNFETKPILKKISEKKNRRFIERKLNANAFLMSANATVILDQVMKKLQNSIWWNSLGLFIVMETNPKTNSCRKALDFLSVIWSYGVLSSIYLCLDEFDIARIYTFNPYEDYAPPFWKKVQQSQSRNGHPWTLYQQKYTHGRVACNDVIFDKTRNLQGYPIRVNACPREPALSIHPSKTGLEKFSGEDGMIMTSVVQVLNATILDISYFGVKCELRLNEDYSIYHGLLADVASKKVDIGMNTRFLRLRKGLLSTYPHIASQLCFATKSKRNVNSWIMIEALFLTMTKSGIFLVFAVSMIVTKSLEGRNISKAFLDSIRLILNTPVTYLPKTIPGRFVGYAELLMLLVLHTLLTARFVSVLTKPINNENIDTLKELQSVRYPVLTLPVFKDTLKHLKLIDRLVIVNNSAGCVTGMIHENIEQVCVENCLFLEAMAMHSNKLYVGTHKLANYFVGYVTNADWPLIGKVNVILQRMVEAGLPNYWRSLNFPRPKEGHMYLLQHTMYTEKSLVLFKNLKFIFRFFAMDLSFASVVFILEIIVKFLFAN